MYDPLCVTGERPCPICDGAGEYNLNIPEKDLVDCGYCNGSGKKRNPLLTSGYEPCPKCNGIGLVKRPSVKLPTTSNNVSERTAVTRPWRFKYDVALSYASEERKKVERYAQLLKKKNISVFFDKHESAKLWGKDLYDKLDEVYRKQAKYCVIFISKSYAKKLWTNHERKSAQARAFNENKEYILPVKLDDTELPGMRETVGYIDLRKTSINELVDLTLRKLRTK